MEPSTSPKGQINGTDLYKSIRGGIVVFIAAFGTVFIGQIQFAIQSGHFPTDIPGIILSVKIAAVATFVELGRRYLTNYQR